MKKSVARGSRSDLVMLLVGQLGLLLAYGFFIGEIALGDGPSAPLPIILLSGVPIAGLVALNRMAPEGASGALVGSWIALLAPLVTVWVYASVRPSFGDSSSAWTAVDMLLFLDLLAGLLGVWGLLRTEERSQRHLIAAAVWALGALLAIVAMAGGHADVLVIAAFVATFAAQAFTAYVLRSEESYSLASAATAS